MEPSGRKPLPLRCAQFEHCEERLALTAQPLADFYIDEIETQSVLTADVVGDLQTASAQTHNLFGVTYAHNTYGFTGAGQTVAVIDTGIAWNHTALGGGYGSNYRVVGGWDFAENDANPYDDGPAGFHGTHVAGIIGSDNVTYGGVAPGVDLVGLRVFNDQGGGQFEWVEQALKWVHENRNSFENPITTVNLSLGTNWNANNTPGWAMLEDEFAQLEADGIFISVAAGNSFQSFGVAGLSYPAASPYVVPVASVNDSGSMSSFSQRNDRVIAAPGEYIVSSAPDYVGNYNGKADDFLAASGTSMAAPYLAGASTLVRQAMEFNGYQNITQDTIYDHFRATADLVYDSATQAYYHVLDLEAALTALMPADEFGSTASTAHALGTVSETFTISGTLGTLTDIDYFTFTAGHTGTLQVGVEGDLDAPRWLTAGLEGAVVAGTGMSLEVVAGQSYTLGLAADGAITHYDLGFEYSAVTSVPTESLLAQARQLDQSLGLTSNGNDYFNWGGAKEKWMQSESGDWYFIKPDGSLHQWSGSGSIANSEQAAQLSTLFYQYTDLLYDAPAESLTDAALAERLDQSLGMKLNRTYSMNWGGMGEKWIQSASGSWLFITPEGNLYAWNGGSDCSSSQLLAEFDASYFTSASLLHDAAAPADTVGELAYQLDQQHNFNTNGQYSTNWGGQGERWIKDGNGSWHFITTDGSLYRWNGNTNLASSTLIAKLTEAYHADPTKLTNAAASGRFLAEQANQLDTSMGLQYGGNSYENWGGMNEKWMKDAQGKWYFITPDGSLYKWSGSSDLSTSMQVAKLDASYHSTPTKLYSSDTPATYLATRAEAFRQSLKFQEIVAPATQSGLQDVRWLEARSGQKYFMNSAGNLYRWGGDTNLASSQFVASFGTSYYSNLSPLTGAGGPAVSSSGGTSTQSITSGGQAAGGGSVANTIAGADAGWMLAQWRESQSTAWVDTISMARAQEHSQQHATEAAYAGDDLTEWQGVYETSGAMAQGEDDPELFAQAFAEDDDLADCAWGAREIGRDRNTELTALDALYSGSEN